MPIKIKKSKDGKYWFNVTAPNGRIICHSETYNRKASVLKGLEAVAKQFAQPLHQAVKDETE